MGKVAQNIWRLMCRFKYQIVIIIGVLLVGFVDEDSFMKRFELEYQISDLKDEIAKYNEQYDKSSAALKRLQRDPNEISRVARERYFMKKDDEDIFVLSDDEQPSDKEQKDETAE